MNVYTQDLNSIFQINSVLALTYLYSMHLMISVIHTRISDILNFMLKVRLSLIKSFK